ncbi:XdhC family protein [Geomonas sp. Red276]
MSQDFEVVRLCLGTEAGFIGLLGSRRKRELLFQTLADEGVAPEERERVVTPVGIDIGAHTPEEIAVSVVAQLIALRSRSCGR